MHPSSIVPCKQWSIPVRLKNTLSPTDEGTLISDALEGSGIKATFQVTQGTLNAMMNHPLF